MVMTDKLEEILTVHGILATQAIDPYSNHIFTCLDRQGTNEQVLLPHQAMDQYNWNLLLLCLFSISTITTFLYGGPLITSTIANIIKHTFESLFYFYSHLLSNAGTDIVGAQHRRGSSWRLLLSGWLLGATFILRLCYLCNMKGDIMAAKMKYTDSIEDVLNRRDIDEYYEGFSYILRVDVSEKETKPANIAFLKKAKTENVTSVCPHIIRRNSALLAASVYYAMLRRESLNCKYVYMGKKQYYLYSTHMFLSASMPPVVQEAVRYRVLRFVETHQRRPWDIYIEFYYDRVNETDSGIHPKPIEMFFLMPIFRVTFPGTALAVICFCLEIAIGKLRKFES